MLVRELVEMLVRADQEADCVCVEDRRVAIDAFDLVEAGYCDDCLESLAAL